MNVPTRLALFATLLAVAFGAAALAGGAIDPDGATDEGGHADVAVSHDESDADAPAGHNEPAGGTAPADDADDAETAAVPGLAAEADGYRLSMTTTVAAGGPGAVPVRFRVLGPDGAPVRSFDVAHEKRMHLVLVRRDLAVFRHVHPELADDGTWSISADLPAAGTYRVYADFTIDGVQRTLGGDLHVPGELVPRALPAATVVARSDGGAEVRLRRDGTRLSFDVLRDGESAAASLEAHLGAKGHLVALRVADLAYLHTHPDGDELAFDTELPSAGAYRVWVELRLDGRVHTAAFTLEVPS